ncbi:hypothetical protein CHELA41_20916 [Hyphomicrobiales bacterium]|nr:hypothetical protein CHELA41_20916 [Hyphomicrobiales bacterium]
MRSVAEIWFIDIPVSGGLDEPLQSARRPGGSQMFISDERAAILSLARVL